MLAAIVRVEGLLLRKGLVCDDTLPAMRHLCRLGFQVFAASDRETILQDDLEAMGATPVCEASLGAKPCTFKCLDAIVNKVGFPKGRIYAISSVFRDIAAAGLGVCRRSSSAQRRKALERSLNVSFAIDMP
jgi:hypothetical protein